MSNYQEKESTGSTIVKTAVGIAAGAYIFNRFVRPWIDRGGADALLKKVLGTEEPVQPEQSQQPEQPQPGIRQDRMRSGRESTDVE